MVWQQFAKLPGITACTGSTPVVSAPYSLSNTIAMIPIKLTLEGNTIKSTNFKPALAVGEFDNTLNDEAKCNVINDYKYGIQLLELFSKYRNDLHINNVVNMLYEMNTVYKKYETEAYEIRRKHTCLYEQRTKIPS